MNIKKTALLTSVAGLLATTAFAAQAQDPMEGETAEAPAFEEIDKNSDGGITVDEAKESWLENRFARVDFNQDGYITKTEYDEARG